MYKFKQEGNHTPSKFIYEILRGKDEHMVFVNSKTLIVDESRFLDYYADWCLSLIHISEPTRPY